MREGSTLGDSKKVCMSLEVSGLDLSPGFEKNKSMSSSDSCCIFLEMFINSLKYQAADRYVRSDQEKI